MDSEMHFKNSVTLFTKCFVGYTVTEQRKKSGHTARLGKTDRPTRERSTAGLHINLMIWLSAHIRLGEN